MSRINIYGGHPERLLGWFDPSAAEAFEEDTRWDGYNPISLATGTQWDHQVLYRTEQTRWVLHTFSQRQGEPDSYRYLRSVQAREWLLINHRDEAVVKFFGPIPAEDGPVVQQSPDKSREEQLAEAYRQGQQSAQRLGDTDQGHAGEEWRPIPGHPAYEVSDQGGWRMRGPDDAVAAGAAALKAAFPTLSEDFTDEWFTKAARIVLEAGAL